MEYDNAIFHRRQFVWSLKSGAEKLPESLIKCSILNEAPKPQERANGCRILSSKLTISRGSYHTRRRSAKFKKLQCYSTHRHQHFNTKIQKRLEHVDILKRLAHSQLLLKIRNTFPFFPFQRILWMTPCWEKGWSNTMAIRALRWESDGTGTSSLGTE